MYSAYTAELRAGVRRRMSIGSVLIVISLGVGAVAAGDFYLGYVPDDHSGSAAVPAGGFFSFDFRIYGTGVEFSYRFVVESGPAVDVYLLSMDDFARYESGQPVTDPSSFSLENVRVIEGSPYLNDGRYQAVIDNTDYGVARPSGSQAVVLYELSAGGRPGWDEFVAALVFPAVGLLAGVTLIAGIILFVLCPFCGRARGFAPCPACSPPSPPR